MWHIYFCMNNVQWVSLLLILFQFYAFYKQAKEGECCESKPGFWDVVKKAKWSEFADIT